MAKDSKAKMGFQNSADSKKNCKVVIDSLDAENRLVAHVKVDTQENGVLEGKGLRDVGVEATPLKIKKSRKKRAASDMGALTTENLEDNGHGTEVDGSQIKDDLKEPTMGEKLASLNILDKSIDKSEEEKDSNNQTKPPSANSMHILVRQALQADDRALLLNCLNIQDERVCFCYSFSFLFEPPVG
ncbi:uncharacterized protein LOC124928398 [Impatiens glandulifera]|uniref:uncharacterized protein LOC124928398 n=2 Tax=Impatiens glandulifera TaxID=253017 RepID=UPI001FB0ABDF|nr:uncharacterized protein LOC124928398 [Impatiens glandulifera]